MCMDDKKMGVHEGYCESMLGGSHTRIFQESAR